MAFSCKLSNNISLSTGQATSCNSTDLSVGVGGIQSPVYVYNIEDVDNLKFENDNRADDSLVIDTIITDKAFYSIDFESASYTEEYGDDKWSHSLTLNVDNILPVFEDLLADGVNSKYLVAFRPNGSQDYRVFGWKAGAKLSYSLTLDSETKGYTITLEDESEYPLMTAYDDNFDVKNKVYTPIFTPLYDVAYCEQTNGHNNGYAIAMYVVKVNSAGQALDANNKLCQWSGLPQDAYKYTSAPDGGYHILGTYNSSASFDGHPVRIYDTRLCPITAQGSITINGSTSATVNLNSTTTSATVTINSTDSWTVTSQQQYVNVNPSNGGTGNTTVTISRGGGGGTDIITFMNRRTGERVTCTANVNIINIGSYYEYPNGTTSFMLTPTVQGGGADYTYTVSPSLTVNKDNQTKYLTCTTTASESEKTFTFTLTHVSDPNEQKTVVVKILGSNSDASWSILSSYCEIE